MKRALYVLPGERRHPGACEIYRAIIPAQMITRHSERWHVNYLWMSDLEAYQDNLDAFVRQYQLFIFPRMFIPTDKPNVRVNVARLFYVLRQNGVYILYEIDDDYTNEFRLTVPGSPTEIASWTDGILCTTHLIGKRYAALAQQRYFVCPNSLVPDIWNPDITGARKAIEKISILLSGSATHEEDWRVLGDVLPKFMAKYEKKVELWIGGYHPEYLRDLPSTRYIPPLPYGEYAKVVQGADIVLCPVIPDDGFNQSKSPIKAVEGMGAKSLVLATDNAVYRLAVSHERTGLLVQHKADAWYGWLVYAVERHKERTKMTKAGFRHAWRQFDATRTWRNWVQAFHKVLRCRPNTAILPIYGAITEPDG